MTSGLEYWPGEGRGGEGRGDSVLEDKGVQKMQIAHICTCRDERSASLEATNAVAPEKILTFFVWLSEKTSN